MNHRIEFKNMGSDIYGDYIVKNGITSITTGDLSKAVVKFSSDLLIITINGNNHFVQSNNKFKSWWNKWHKMEDKEIMNCKTCNIPMDISQISEDEIEASCSYCGRIIN